MRRRSMKVPPLTGERIGPGRVPQACRGVGPAVSWGPATEDPQMRPIRPFLLAALLALPACATVEGAGRDLSRAGELVSEGAREVRRAF